MPRVEIVHLEHHHVRRHVGPAAIQQSTSGSVVGDGGDDFDELVADGSTSHATVDGSTRVPTRVPTWFAEAVATAEG